MKASPMLVLAAALLAGSSLACSSTSTSRLRPGTGDVAFRLVWEGESDLDLFVADPAGSCAFFGHRQSELGGILDIDCNAASDRMCNQPVENVYWPTRTAPSGTYQFWIKPHVVLPAESPLSFEVQLLRGTEIVWRHSGTALSGSEVLGPFALDFARGGESLPALSGGEIPPCPIPFLPPGFKPGS